MKQVLIDLMSDYASLIFGIVVVIVLTITLIVLVHNYKPSPCEAYKNYTINDIPVRCLEHFKINR